MDKTQLITIVVTAVITAIAKEVVVWLVGIVKSLSMIKTIKAKLKAIFNKTNRTIIREAFTITLYLAFFVYFARDPSPPTRFEILLAIGIVFAMFVSVVNLLINIVKIKMAQTENKTKP